MADYIISVIYWLHLKPGGGPDSLDVGLLQNFIGQFLIIQYRANN